MPQQTINCTSRQTEAKKGKWIWLNPASLIFIKIACPAKEIQLRAEVTVAGTHSWDTACFPSKTYYRKRRGFSAFHVPVSDMDSSNWQKRVLVHRQLTHDQIILTPCTRLRHWDGCDCAHPPQRLSAKPFPVELHSLRLSQPAKQTAGAGWGTCLYGHTQLGINTGKNQILDLCRDPIRKQERNSPRHLNWKILKEDNFKWDSNPEQVHSVFPVWYSI